MINFCISYTAVVVPLLYVSHFMQLVLFTGLGVHTIMLEGWSYYFKCLWSRIFEAVYFKQTAV